MPTEFPTARFLGIDFANMTYAEVAGELDSLSRKDSFSYIVTPNVDHIVQLNEGENDEVAPAFRTAYQSAQLRLCDSRVVQLLARLRSVHVDVVTGSDLTAYLFSEGYLNGRKVALIGGDDKIIEAVQLRYPAVLIDQHQPPMGVLGNPSARSQIVDFIAKGSFDVVLFAIGAPQSEIICHQCYLNGQSRGVALCIGAAVEFLVGRKVRAPEWMQRARLEWAFRLMSEPRRLWRRYLIVGPRIFRLALSSGGH